MKVNSTSVAISLLLSAGAQLLQAQVDFTSWPVQIHGFASQGFVKSDANNYLTMYTRGGTFQFTDGGLNATAQVGSRLRVGAQVYVRSVGALGRWRPTLDWAIADYKVSERLSVRGGKVKTIFGLYNDIQDMESLHTWAILPQSLYSLDLRSSTIAHLGGDLYGEAPLGRNLGSFAYTAFAGRYLDDKYGGYRNVALQNGVKLDEMTGSLGGGDFRWLNLKPGLTLGMSILKTSFQGGGKLKDYNLPARFSVSGQPSVYYVDYLRGNLHLSGEYSRTGGTTQVFGIPGLSAIRENSLGWYTSLAYRVWTRLELGAYHSRFVSDIDRDWDDPGNHIYDQALTARLDMNRHWSIKVEGHFMDGYGSVFSARGFYLNQNPNGFERRTNMFIIRSGYTF